jgi:pyruvate/2-oxoglutarate dehydrogenase complex dihydrolipoamide dehydrogenase (E3) component
MSEPTIDVQEFDVIVLGGGPVGENLADRAVAGGMSVALVEHELVGGECSYWACIPSKVLLRSGSALRSALRVPGAAESVTGTIDPAAVLARRNEFVGDWDDAGQVDWLESIGVTFVRGHGRLDGARRVVVAGHEGGERMLVARHAVAVCTGSEPVTPPIDGLDSIDAWTSRDATGAKEVPGSLAIVGGGVVGVEMATAYAGLGSAVTLLARSGLLAGMEEIAGEAVADGLRGLGASVRLGVSPVAVHRTSGNTVHIDLDDGSSIDADELLMATGRRPRTGSIGLDTVGLPTDEPLAVDDTLRATGDYLDGNVGWLYAVGDVNGRALLTHQGKYQARAAGDVIAARAMGRAVEDEPWGAHTATADHAAVPQVVFAEPEVASVGLTGAEARRAGHRVRVVDYELGSVSGAGILAEGYRGKARLVVDTDREVVLGATLVGQDVAELVHAATVAIVGEVPIGRLWHAVPSFPTMSEIWLRLLETYGRPGFTTDEER